MHPITEINVRQTALIKAWKPSKIITTIYDSFYGPHRYCSDCVHVKLRGLKTDPKMQTTPWHQVPI